MTIVSKTAISPSFRRSRRLLTGFLVLYFSYTFIPLLYVIVSSTKSNADLFGTFGLWFSSDFQLLQNLRDLFTYQDGIFSRWLLNTDRSMRVSRGSERRSSLPSRAMPSRNTSSPGSA